MLHVFGIMLHVFGKDHVRKIRYSVHMTKLIAAWHSRSHMVYEPIIYDKTYPSGPAYMP